jgi:hypothetical protein
MSVCWGGSYGGNCNSDGSLNNQGSNAYYWSSTYGARKHKRNTINQLKFELDLEANPRKFYLQHYSKGVAFLGVVVYPYHTVIGRRIRKNYFAAPPEKKEEYHAFFMHHNAFKLKERGVVNG